MQDQQGSPFLPGSEIRKDMGPKNRPIDKARVINKLNYINFQDESILIVFEHNKYAHTISLHAKPQPCLGEELECLWPDSELEIYRQLNSYRFREIQIPDGKNAVVIRPEDIFINAKVANFLLPETSYELRSRDLRRYPCNNITAQLIQNSISFSGSLIDFNRGFFRIEVLEQGNQALFWINKEAPLNLIITGDNGIIYSGECDIAQVRNGVRTGKTYILNPVMDHIKRFAQKNFRATRYQLVPPPYVILSHPFTQKSWSLRILDVSGSGFSVEENAENSLLVPGMILRDLEIHLANSLNLKCNGQVVHQVSGGDGDRKGYVKTGIAIFEMDSDDHTQLLSLLHQATNPNLFLNGKVSEDDLWRFFFESGFIYPSKYEFIKDNKESLKATYKKIYSESPQIAKHFIYQDRGQILGHMAIVRFYQKAWLIQHHAAHHTNSKLAGVEVLDQIGRFVNETGNLLSMNMDYVFCYFRPENKFPNQVFGGAARNIKDPKICSLDSFAYFHYQTKSDKEPIEIKPPWSLSTTQPQDLVELKLFYEETSGGIMLDAFGLLPDSMDISDLIQEYNHFGFKRGRYIFTLRKENSIKAFFFLNLADLGLNLSDITNSIHIFVVDFQGFNEEILEYALLKLSQFYEKMEIPVLLYPQDCADKLHIAYEKIYQLWVLKARSLDYYFGFMKRYFKRLNSIQAQEDKP